MSKVNVPGFPKSPLAGLNGGQKQLYLRHYGALIQECRPVFGDDWCRAFFCLTQRTLESMDRRPCKQRPSPKSISDKQLESLSIRMEILRSELAELRNNQRELEKLFREFVETTSSQIARTLITPLLRYVLRFEGELPESADPLNIDSLLAAAKRK